MKLTHGYELEGNKIDKARPYDDANYYYAITLDSSETWYICKNGKKIKEIEFDDISEISEELNMVNSTIKSIIIHN